jgi:hypothetical protein
LSEIKVTFSESIDEQVDTGVSVLPTTAVITSVMIQIFRMYQLAANLQHLA